MIKKKRNGRETRLKSTGTDDEQHEYEYLGAWGPRFDKLADMYGPAEESEEED